MTDSIDTRTVSPKEFGRAVGVSESTVKRWVDQGRLSSTRTAGGHRRISALEALRAIRSLQLELRDPSILGVSDLVGSDQQMASPSEAFHTLIANGESKQATQLVMGEYMRGSAIWEIADQIVRPAMHRIGLEGNAPEAILSEHRATQIVLEIAQTLRRLASSSNEASEAIVGAVSGDPYQIPCVLISGVISEAGLHATNLGPDTPGAVFMRALEGDVAPKLIAVSVSRVVDVSVISNEINELVHRAEAQDCRIALGGRAIGDLAIDPLPCVRIHTSMASLAQDVQDLQVD